MSIPAAWHPDPTGRHEYRYWDGQRWTEHVANAGQRAIDPLDGRPAAASGQQAPAQASSVEQPTQPAAQATQPAAQTETQTATPAAAEGPTQTTGTDPAPDASTVHAPAPSIGDAPASDASGGDAPEADAATTPSAEQATPASTSSEPSTSVSAESAPADEGSATGSHLYAVDQPAPGAADDTDTQDTTTPAADDDSTSPQDAASALVEPPPLQHDGDDPASGTADGTRPEVAADGDPTEPSFQPAAGARPSDNEAQDAAGNAKKTRRTAKKAGAQSSAGTRRDSLGNGPAVAALILGVVAALVALVPFVGMIAVPLGLGAVVLGLIGRRRGKRSGMGKGTATTGLMTGAAGMILGAAITVLFVWVVQQSGFGINELAACIDQTGDARSCSQQFQSAFFDQLFGRS
ncbi:MAG: DUF2510 domain-containing protein [Nitriliruptoraceae bacterium]